MSRQYEVMRIGLAPGSLLAQAAHPGRYPRWTRVGSRDGAAPEEEEEPERRDGEAGEEESLPARGISPVTGTQLIETLASCGPRRWGQCFGAVPGVGEDRQRDREGQGSVGARAVSARLTSTWRRGEVGGASAAGACGRGGRRHRHGSL